MTSLFQIDLFAMILKGILIGIIASAPMGPVGILCIQRTLNK
ncbi:MAG: lysine transporter LysE, partial [Prevotella sp.]